MIVTPSKKNKIFLTDYNYRRDIENRLLMAQFAIVEVEVLEEILNGPLKTSISQITEDLGKDYDTIVSALTKLSKTGLLTFKGNTVDVNKTMRKYYDFQFLKFDNDFKPKIEFLQGLLRKVPIEVLPSWYSISKTSDNIFESIIEKHLLTPRIFELYLSELQFEDPIFDGIIFDVFHAPDFCLESDVLRKKYGLTRELFEEYLLHLEFNFICCLSYRRKGKVWKEVVTPFQEWRDYLRFLQKTICKPIATPEQLTKSHEDPFGFIDDMTLLLKQANTGTARVSQETPPLLDKNTLNTLSQQTHAHPDSLEKYLSSAIDMLLQLELAVLQEKQLIATNEGDKWLKLDLRERALYLHHQIGSRVLTLDPSSQAAMDRNIREIKRGLRRAIGVGWITFSNFIKGMVEPIGNAQEVMLRRVGKQWKYEIPTYSDEEIELIRITIFERLFRLGVVETGKYEDEQGKEEEREPCFRITPFGEEILTS